MILNENMVNNKVVELVNIYNFDFGGGAIWKEGGDGHDLGAD
jgi:hypothetical protein